MNEADNNLAKAFELLVEELNRSSKTVVEQGIEAMRLGDYEKARHSTVHAERLRELESRVRALQHEWLQIKTETRSPRDTKLLALSKRPRVSHRQGERTPHEAFRKPILEALVKLGGKAPVSDVLLLVREQMRPYFKPADWAPLASNPTTSRWRNAAQWCRLFLVQEGLLKEDSPRGIWEITEAGREWLKHETSE
ncbi:MAG: hypothetical protein D6691_12580 [Candidatus Hydrogenedentota bacterium]|jgi:hypothetical protein|nr:winged helix-turn-helix domain-containing protein [Candidatus Sumerlaea chitinivorans]RMH23819.1 MAG: hypothetical protein D6691_12580 [Candidatus Hydrogenedentota bacterium]